MVTDKDTTTNPHRIYTIQDKIARRGDFVFCDFVSFKRRLTDGRNRLVHYGIKPNDVLNEEMGWMILQTEQIMAKVIGLDTS